VSGALRHHTAYRPHKVLACGGVVGTSIVVTGSSIAPGGPHYVSLWSLPSRSGGAREGPLLPVLVHRRETPSPMSAITYSARLDRLYTGGETSGLVYEWSFDENRKSASADATGPKALGRCRTLRLHTFGVTTIVELERRKRHSNLIVTGSTDGNINVWNPSDWFGGGAADDATFDSAALGEDHSSAAVPAPHGRKELVPVLQLAAQSTGPGTIVVSVDHGLLFSAGRLSVKDATASTVVLVWKLSEHSQHGLKRRIHAQLTRHSAQISDVVEVVDCVQINQ
jgi:WD40 repeat protein